MSKNDLQETNVAKEKKENTLTIEDIRAAIIGDQNKIILLNVFDNLVKTLFTNSNLLFLYSDFIANLFNIVINSSINKAVFSSPILFILILFIQQIICQSSWNKVLAIISFDKFGLIRKIKGSGSNTAWQSPQFSHKTFIFLLLYLMILKAISNLYAFINQLQIFNVLIFYKFCIIFRINAYKDWQTVET